MRRRNAFTLLEVLLALALTAMLMAGLFAMLRVQGRMAREGGRLVERAQVARGLLDQIAADVRSSVSFAGVEPAGTGLATAVAEVIPMASDDDRTSTLAAFSLTGRPRLPEPLRTLADRSRTPGAGVYGDADHLVVSPRVGDEPAFEAPFSNRGAPASVNATLATKRPTESLITSDREISFDSKSPFGVPGQAVSADRPKPTRAIAGVAYFLLRDRSEATVAEEFEIGNEVGGLARLELSRSDPETAAALIDEAFRQLQAAFTETDVTTGDDLLDFEPEDPASDGEKERNDASFLAPGLRVDLLAPEVRWLRFRYLGPYGWQRSWNSKTTAPRAVEIALGLKKDPESPSKASPSIRQLATSARSDNNPAASLDEPQTNPTLPDPSDFAQAETTPLARELLPSDLQIYRLIVRVPTGPATGRTLLNESLTPTYQSQMPDPRPPTPDP